MAELEITYNVPLSLEFKKAVERSGVSISALSTLTGYTTSRLQKYVELKRTIVRSDVERVIVAVTAILNECCDKGLLPLGIPKNNSKYHDKLLQTVNDYIEQKTK